jgi:formylglycine-generating enzyme required for sulfatase activity
LIVNDGRVDSDPDVVEVTVNEITEFGETLTVNLPGGVAMDMIWIEPGTFLMGSPESEQGRGENEGPQHEVMISRGFYLGKFELTQEQWEGVMETSPWSGDKGNDKYDVQEQRDHPAVYISWNDVQEFVHRLNVAAGDSLYRLPTEAEWEYAARAGTATRWSFGEDESRLGDYAWYEKTAAHAQLGYGQPVGTKLPNPWGLYDMYGNVWEWWRRTNWCGGQRCGPRAILRATTRSGRTFLLGNLRSLSCRTRFCW